jgi:hypothetical protein
MDDPANASLPGCLADGSPPAGASACDRTNNAQIFPLDMQGRPPIVTEAGGNAQPQASLAVNPLAGARYAHTSGVRFGNTDLWVRDVQRTIDDALARAQPDGNQVVLIGYSFGAQRIGRALDRFQCERFDRCDIYGKVSKAIFLAPLFYAPGGAPQPRDETPPFVTFPLTATDAAATARAWAIAPATRDAACTGRVLPGAVDELWAQTAALDGVGAGWGGSVPGQPTGLSRSPTFSTYGFNPAAAATLTLPTLVM